MTKPYSLTEEHRAQLKPWADRWIANAMSTEPMTDQDRAEAVVALKQLYAKIGLGKPKVIFVPSPFAALNVVGAVEALRQAGRKTLPRSFAGWPVDAVRLAGWVAELTSLPARGTAPKFRDISQTAADARMDSHRDSVWPAAAFSLAGRQALINACEALDARDGGNQWSAEAAYLSFFRVVAKLGLDYSAWLPYERLAEISGVRYTLPTYVVVCDRPEVLTVDDQNRPHGERGMACRFRDGTGWWYWHGQPVPQHLVEAPETITLEEVRSQTNEERRRIYRERYGDLRYLKDTGAVLLDADVEQARKGAAPRMLVEDDQGERWLIGTDGGTGRNYVMATERTATTCKEAHEARTGFDETRVVNKS